MGNGGRGITPLSQAGPTASPQFSQLVHVTEHHVDDESRDQVHSLPAVLSQGRGLYSPPQVYATRQSVSRVTQTEDSANDHHFVARAERKRRDRSRSLRILLWWIIAVTSDVCNMYVVAVHLQPVSYFAFQILFCAVL